MFWSLRKRGSLMHGQVFEVTQIDSDVEEHNMIHASKRMLLTHFVAREEQTNGSQSEAIFFDEIWELK